MSILKIAAEQAYEMEKIALLQDMLKTPVTAVSRAGLGEFKNGVRQLQRNANKAIRSRAHMDALDQFGKDIYSSGIKRRGSGVRDFIADQLRSDRLASANNLRFGAIDKAVQHNISVRDTRNLMTALGPQSTCINRSTFKCLTFNRTNSVL